MSQKENTIGLDTSFVLRLLVGEPVALARQAVEQLDTLRAGNQRAAVSDVVACETYFALNHHYGVPKQLALETIRKFLESPEIIALGEALRILRQPNLGRANPGFVDRMIHAEYLSRTASMLSFEKAAAKLPGVRIPK